MAGVLFGINGGNFKDKRRDLCLQKKMLKKKRRASAVGPARGPAHVHVLAVAPKCCGWVSPKRFEAQGGIFRPRGSAGLSCQH